MTPELLAFLVDPVDGGPLRLENDTLVGASGARYPVVDGIPRFVGALDGAQEQTAAAFGYKWRRRSSFDSPGMQDAIRARVVTNYGFGTVEAMREYFAGRTRILDAGCGAGLPASAWMEPGWSSRGAAWVGLDISEAIDVARERLGHIDATQFVQGDVLRLPFAAGAFDTVFSEGVLHHTPSTERALGSLVDVLAPGGELLFYVYRRKGPIREFTDDFVRDRIADLQPDEAWDAMRSFALLGKALADLDAEVDVPDVPLLGIRAGRYDVQRLIYWHVAKLYWSNRFSVEENTHVNFDWYRPRYAHRHTAGEVRAWCERLGLRITHFDEAEAGFTVRARRATTPARAGA